MYRQLAFLSCAAMLVLVSATPVGAATSGSETAALSAMSSSDAPRDDAPLVGEQFTFITASGAAIATSSLLAYSYAGAGCMQIDGNPQPNGDFDADVQLPDGATIVGIRAWYYDASASGNIMVSLMEFDGAGNFSVVAQATSSGSAGYGSAWATPAATYVVDNYGQGLALRFEAVPDTTGSTLRHCGVRIMWAP